jgi:putative inorganic carbon (HCO3(-)) transporter
MSGPGSTTTILAAVDGPKVRLADIASLGIFLAFLGALLQPTMPNPFLLEPGTSWTIVCYAFAVPVLVFGWVRGHRRQVSPFDYVLCGYLAFVVATWPASVDREQTGIAVARLAGQVAVYCAVRRLAADWPVLGRIFVAALAGGIAVLEWRALDYHLRAGLIARLAEFPSLEWNGREGLGVLGVIQFALLLGIWQRAQRRTVRIASMLLLVGSVVELVFLYSRMPWVAAACVLGVAFMTAMRLGGFWRYALGVAAITAIVAVVGTPYVLHLVRTAVGLEYGTEGGLDFRFVLWRNGINIVSQHALGGVGLGNFMEVHQKLYPMPFDIRPNEAAAAHPHNLFLQQAAEVGVPGGLAYVALWGTALWAGWRICKRATAGFDVGMSLFFALVSIVVVNMGENMFLDLVAAERARVHTIAWIVIGFVVAEWNRARQPDANQLAHAA